MDHPKASSRMALLTFLLTVAFILGCVPATWEPPPASPPPAEPAPSAAGKDAAPPEPSTGGKPSGLVHTVRWKGESLSVIAKWYTGDMNRWKALAEHNPLSDPNRIRIGDRISIPESLLRTREPLPKAFVEQHASESGPTPPSEPQKEKTIQQVPPKDDPSPASQDPQDTPELFGPKELKGE